MSDIDFNALEPTAFNLEQITLFSTNGTNVDLKLIVDELNIYEDIFSNVVTGDILVTESINIVSQYAIHGNEYLRIVFSSPEFPSYDKYFRVYKISDKNLKTMNSVQYKLHFCSEEFILNQQIRLSKSYKGLYLNEIVDDIISNVLDVDITKRFPIFSGAQLKDVIIPNMRPFEAINWLASMAVTDELNSAFLCYENRYGFNFRSLSDLYQQDAVKIVRIKAKNTTDASKPDNIINIDRFEIKQQFNVLDGINAGAYSSFVTKLDLMRRKFETVGFDPVTNNVKLLNDYLPFNSATNRLGVSLIGGSSYVRLQPSTDEDLFDRWLLQRASEFALLNTQKVVFAVPGDSQTTIGDVLVLDFPDYSPAENSENITADMSLTGKYLITGIRHRIARNKYYSFVEVCKNSNAFDMVAAADSPPYEEARKL